MRWGKTSQVYNCITAWLSARCWQALLKKGYNLYAEYIMQSARLGESQAGIKIAGRNINNLRYADDTTFMAEGEDELKSLLKVKEWKSWLKVHHSEN